MTVDWSECDLVESVAGKVGGKPVVKGTRIPTTPSPYFVNFTAL
jgi:uncharacterized protein (DUF433 family)